MKVGVIVGSTREGRLGERVAKWVVGEAEKQEGWEVELLDLKELNLPLYHEALQPAELQKNYPDEAVKSWSQKIEQKEAFIFITPEYNHGLPASLKNAIDWLYPEWNDKAAALVSYSNGNGGGIRALEQLRQTLAHVGVATVQQETTIARAQDHFSPKGEPTTDSFNGALSRQMTQLDKWGRALSTIRE